MLIIDNSWQYCKSCKNKVRVQVGDKYLKVSRCPLCGGGLSEPPDEPVKLVKKAKAKSDDAS